MAYLQMYNIITVWIFHKTDQRKSLHGRETNNDKLVSFNRSALVHTKHHVFIFMKGNMRFVLVIHTMLQHGFISRLWNCVKKHLESAGISRLTRYDQTRRRLLAHASEDYLDNPMRLYCIGCNYTSAPETIRKNKKINHLFSSKHLIFDLRCMKMTLT